MAEAGTETREFRASARYVRMSPFKARLVMDVVRGRSVPEALTILKFVNKRAAPYIGKLIESAVANAEDRANRTGVDIDAEKLVVSEARVDGGPLLKRFRPRSRGMANRIHKRTCHLHVKVAEAEVVEERKAGKPAWRKPRKRISAEERKAKRAAKQEG